MLVFLNSFSNWVDYFSIQSCSLNPKGARECFDVAEISLFNESRDVFRFFARD